METYKGDYPLEKNITEFNRIVEDFNKTYKGFDTPVVQKLRKALDDFRVAIAPDFHSFIMNEIEIFASDKCKVEFVFKGKSFVMEFKELSKTEESLGKRKLFNF